MSPPEQVYPLGNEDDVRAEGTGLRDRHDVLTTRCLGLLGARYDAGGIGPPTLHRKRDDPYGPSPKPWNGLLHDGGKEAVEV